MFCRNGVPQTVTQPLYKIQTKQQQPQRQTTLTQFPVGQQPTREFDAGWTAPASSSSSSKPYPSSVSSGQFKRRLLWPPKPTASPSVPAQLFDFLRMNKQHLSQANALSQRTEGQFQQQQFLHCLQELLGTLTAEDFNVSKADVLPGVGYQEVYSGPEMTVCVFTLSAGMKLPLHDHPQMHVFARLLLGQLRVTSYDLIPNPGLQEEWPREVVLEGNILFDSAPATFSLGPERGNLHELVALEDCAFFDVLFPSYDSAAGRHCTYFKHWVDPASQRHYVTPEQPSGLSMHQRPYRGPPFGAFPA